MNISPEELAEWQAALRDPKRRQIKRALESSEGQCCLGVLCELQIDPLQLKRECFPQAVTYNGETTALPKVVSWKFKTSGNGPGIPLEFLTKEEAFMVRRNYRLGKEDVTDEGEPCIWVSVLNDLGVSFPRIADLLSHAVTPKSFIPVEA